MKIQLDANVVGTAPCINTSLYSAMLLFVLLLLFAILLFVLPFFHYVRSLNIYVHVQYIYIFLLILFLVCPEIDTVLHNSTVYTVGMTTDPRPEHFNVLFIYT